MTGPRDPGQPGWGQPGGPGPDPTRAFPQPGPWTGAYPPPGQGGQPPYGPPQNQPYGGQPAYSPPQNQPYGGQPGYGGRPGYEQPGYGTPPGQPPGFGGFPPETGSGGRGRGPLIGVLAAVLVLLVVLGIVLYVRSGNGTPAPVAAGTSSTTTPAPSASTPAPSSATPPRPSSVAPSTTTPAPPTTSRSGSASPQDVQAISDLAKQLVNAISAGDQPTLQSIACGTFGSALAGFTSPTDPPIVYDHTEAVSVTGNDGTAEVFAADGPTAPSAQTMTVQRAGGTWKVCGLGNL